LYRAASVGGAGRHTITFSVADVVDFFPAVF
jgi:hypothetical protein